MIEQVQVVLATHNPGKVREVAQVLAEMDCLTGIDLISAGELQLTAPQEDGVSFAENALLKARAASEASGLPVIAEDSGLCVKVLGGAPGIFSARWAGQHGGDLANLQLLLDQLADVPDQHRGAWYECAAVLMLPSGQHFQATGRLTGQLAHQPVGDGGFGYDPIFIPEAMALTAAQLDPAAKNAISHRGRAIRALAPHLSSLA